MKIFKEYKEKLIESVFSIELSVESLQQEINKPLSFAEKMRSSFNRTIEKMQEQSNQRSCKYRKEVLQLKAKIINLQSKLEYESQEVSNRSNTCKSNETQKEQSRVFDENRNECAKEENKEVNSVPKSSEDYRQQELLDINQSLSNRDNKLSDHEQLSWKESTQNNKSQEEIKMPWDSLKILKSVEEEVTPYIRSLDFCHKTDTMRPSSEKLVSMWFSDYHIIRNVDYDNRISSFPDPADNMLDFPLPTFECTSQIPKIDKNC